MTWEITVDGISSTRLNGSFHSTVCARHMFQLIEEYHGEAIGCDGASWPVPDVDHDLDDPFWED